MAGFPLPEGLQQADLPAPSAQARSTAPGILETLDLKQNPPDGGFCRNLMRDVLRL